MKGPKWNSLLKEESDIAKSVTENPAVKTRLPGFLEKFTEHRSAQQSRFLLFSTGLITIQPISTFFLKWSWLGEKEQHEARDVYADAKGRLWVVKDVGTGSERLAVEFYKEPFQKVPTWRLEPVGPDFAVVGDHLYVLGVTNKLWYNSLWLHDARTGKARKCLYKETDPRINCGLLRKEGGRILFTRELNQDFTYYELNTKTHALTNVPAEHAIPRSWKLPKDLDSLGISFCWPQQGLLITKFHGSQTLWGCNAIRPAKKLLTIPGGSIEPDRWSAFQNSSSSPCLIHVNHPAEGVKAYLWSKGSLSLLFKPDTKVFHYKATRSQTKSADGTTVHMCSVYNPSLKPKKLLVWGYGAYGIPTGFGSVATHWAPLLDQGWCIACVYLRGGGDHTEAWGKEGRREGRWKTLADFQAGIQALQKELSIPASMTVIYGRSAGGLLVGATLGLHPKGDLMSAVFTEVPYVDVLRTTTNPTLPLTRLEYNEFGDPAHRVEDLVAVSQMSPADLAVGLKTPNVFVFCRTAVNDSEVYAYEPVKWVRRLRQGSPKGAPKVVFISGGQGHFTPPDSQKEAYALDCAVLDAWAEGEF